jgi:hypothetical protein
MEDINSKTKTDNASEKKLFERRFKVVLSLLRLGGISISMKSTPVLHSVYNITISACFYTTVVCNHVDTVFYTHQLVEAVKKIRVMVGMHLCMWIHLSVRYATLKYFVIS